MTTNATLDEAVKRVSLLVNHYHRDAPFRAPETVPGFQARLLNALWEALLDAQDTEAK